MHSHRIDKATTQQASGHKNNNVGTRRGEYEAEEIVHETTYLRSRYIIERLGGNIRSGSLEYFFNHVLPPLKPEFDIDRIYDFCIKEKILYKRRGSKKYAWKGVRKNLKSVKENKMQFINILHAVVKVAQGVTSADTSLDVTFTCFDKLNDDSEVKLGGNKNDDQDAVIYLESTLENHSYTLEERRSYNTSFSFHLKKSKEDAYDVRFLRSLNNNANVFHV